MSAPLKILSGPRCQRCASPLAYEGRPCPLCLSPAVFIISKGTISAQIGKGRRAKARLPLYAQPAAVRGREVKLPRGERAIKTLATIGRWTWNSLSIAAAVHIVFLLMAFMFRADIEKALLTQDTLKLEQARTAAPVTAPAPAEFESPELQPLDDELVFPEEMTETPVQDAGDPLYEAPDEPTPMAEMPDIAPPAPRPPSDFKFTRPDSAQGLGGGRPQAAPEAAGGAGLFKNRSGETKQAALKQFGGGEDTENAVNLGLEYLAKKQSPNGSWDPNDGFRHPPEWARGDNGYRGAVTALCVLPFLAAGNSTTSGEYKRNVQRAIDWLLSNQGTDGFIGYRNSIAMYTHTVATLALCEAYGLGAAGDEDLKLAAERAVRYLERTQGVGGGWDYNAYAVSGGPRGYERNDLSISGWAALAFKSARACGITVNQRNWDALSGLYERQTLATGETNYADRYHGSLPGTRRGIGMVGVGLAVRCILDADRFDKVNQAAEGLLLKDLPVYARLLDPSQGSENPNFHTFYGWYYGTLGLFLKNDGKGAAWETWNAQLKASLLENQVLKGPRKGSWPADDTWIGPIMGDLYSTACSILCLEVYYRYNPTHRPAQPPAAGVAADTPETDRRKIAGFPKPDSDVAEQPKPKTPSGPSARSAALRAIAKEKGLGAVADLIGALKDESLSVRTTALTELGRLKAADAAPSVAAMLADPANDSIRISIAYALGKLGDRSQYPALIRMLGDSEKSVAEAAKSALGQLSGGQDHGINKDAWRDWFERNP